VPATKTAFSSRPTLAWATPSFLFGREAEELEETILGKIRERAYLLFEQSGREPGNEDANWSRAESEILRCGVQIRESGTWVALSFSIPDASGQGVQIAVRPSRVVVRARVASNEREASEGAKQDEREIFLAANLAVEVDPPSAAASFRDHTLHLMIKKRRPISSPATKTPEQND
jgi:HSP20 family molecular chaperone IbpA